jgi:FlaG/FlaF family flagellin (archaellin)
MVFLILFCGFNNYFSKNKIEKVKDTQNILRAMRQLSECRSAASSVIGVVLLVGMTVIMVSVIALSVFAYGAFEQQPVPEAKIVVMEAKGGLASSGTSFKNNTILLKHKGGDSLDIKNLKMIITGTGQSHRGFGSTYVPSESPYTGSVQVIYLNLINYGKDPIYETHNKLTFKDGYWTPGETFLLSGDDGGDSNDKDSSVWVTINEDGDTSNNYGFKARSKISITLIDTVTNQIICTVTANVRPV